MKFEINISPTEDFRLKAEIIRKGEPDLQKNLVSDVLTGTRDHISSSRCNFFRMLGEMLEDQIYP